MMRAGGGAPSSGEESKPDGGDKSQCGSVHESPVRQMLDAHLPRQRSPTYKVTVNETVDVLAPPSGNQIHGKLKLGDVLINASNDDSEKPEPIRSTQEPLKKLTCQTIANPPLVRVCPYPSPQGARGPPPRRLQTPPADSLEALGVIVRGVWACASGKLLRVRQSQFGFTKLG